MSEFVNTIELLGDDAVTDSIIERTIAEFKDNMLTKVGQYAFMDCTALETVVLPNITAVGVSAFQNCSQLTEIDMPNVTSIGQNAFAGCKLSRCDFPEVTNIGATAIRGTFTTVTLPKLKTLKDNVFCTQCRTIEFADLGMLTSMPRYTFYEATNLKTLILRNPNGTAMGDSGAFYVTMPTNLTIYVPSALIDSGFYSTATNWSAIYEQFTWKSLEGSEYA